MITKDEITVWLKRHGRTRKWLAQECGISEGTMNNQFSQGFSATTLATIDKLMKLDALSAEGHPDETGLITFTTAEFERLEKARAAVGNPARPVFYREAIIQFVEVLEIEEAEGEQSRNEEGIALLADEGGEAGEEPAPLPARRPVQYPTGRRGAVRRGVESCDEMRDRHPSNSADNKKARIQKQTDPLVRAESTALFAVGAAVRFDSGEILGRSGVVTSSELRECPIDRKEAWYYRVQWAGERTDQGLYHETLLCPANDSGEGRRSEDADFTDQGL